ncbi:MAG: ATP-binding protein [Chitinispirillaceae bacterium]|jgi:anti-sigma regulatory factor (Ser/Thr protein kinase)|nr:ATP-binding protein [Chitinispirillaceae bacterium]
MVSENPEHIDISFPGELEYIPLIRKLIADMLLVLNFSSRFTFRSEIIIDELCSNAVSYGAGSTGTACSPVRLTCEVYRDRVEYTVKDAGGSTSDISRLKQAIAAEVPRTFDDTEHGLGLELVRMLSENLTCSIDENNVTQVHAVRRRETVQP